MYNFVLELILITTLSVMVYLMARAIPRVAHLATPQDERPFGKLDQMIAKLPLEKLDRWMQEAFMKFLRKLKIVILKIDNYLNAKLTVLKTRHDTIQKNISLKDKMDLLEVNKAERDEKLVSTLTELPLEEKKEN